MILKLTRLATCATCANAVLTLDFDQRQRSRQRVVLDAGEGVCKEAGILLPPGTVLRDGDVLESEDGVTVRVRAALETVSEARAQDPQTLARACYHLGNRHIVVQIGAGWLRYRHDHVLDDMLRRLGLLVTCEQAPFAPESGAYAGGHGHHGHGHAHDH